VIFNSLKGGNKINRFLSKKKYIFPALWMLNKHILPRVDIYSAPPYDTPFHYPPVFIIGAPRSGSTLLFQVLINTFDVAYLSNLHCQFFGAPAYAERVISALKKNKALSNYTSYLGQTSGALEPSECGEWWYRFFRRNPAYVTIDDVDEGKMHNFRRSLFALTEAAGKPVFFKNLYASIRLEAISAHIPESLYIIIKREELYNASSILAARRKTLGHYDKWWSVPPPDIATLQEKEPAEQAIGQIRCIYSEIDRVIRKKYISPINTIEVKYEELCHNVHGTVKRLSKFFSSNGLFVNFTLENIPQRFLVHRSVSINKKLFAELQKILSIE